MPVYIAHTFHVCPVAGEALHAGVKSEVVRLRRYPCHIGKVAMIV